jgi:tripartite-type tricarboxylate transporter receptor subunit TctC
MPRITTALAWIAGIAVAASFETAPAQTYPAKPIQVLVPFTSGAGTDLIARATGEEFKSHLGQPFVYLNKEGASGMIAFGELTRAAPDGYTVIFAPNGQMTLMQHIRKEMPFDPAKVDPICQLFEAQFAVAVSEKSPFASLGDLIAAAKKSPGQINWGVMGIGTIPHLQWHALESAAGIQTTAIGYKNQGVLLQETMSQQVAFTVTTIASLGSHPLRALVVLDVRRSAKLLDVPTAAEFGYSVTTASFGGIYAPVGLPRDVRKTLSTACAKVGQSAALKTTLERLGADLIHLDSEAFAQRLATDRKVKGEAVKALNLTVE